MWLILRIQGFWRVILVVLQSYWYWSKKMKGWGRCSWKVSEPLMEAWGATSEQASGTRDWKASKLFWSPSCDFLCISIWSIFLPLQGRNCFCKIILIFFFAFLPISQPKDGLQSFPVLVQVPIPNPQERKSSFLKLAEIYIANCLSQGWVWCVV